jgi:hypothetical protein
MHRLIWARLTELCTITLRNIRIQTREPQEFFKAALESLKWGLIENEEFRNWFTGNVTQRKDELLKVCTGDSDEVRLCRILISALAHAKDDYARRSLSTPSTLPVTPSSSLSKKGQDEPGLNYEKRASPYSHSKSKETNGSSSKKRKVRAYVEDAVDSD